MDGRWCVAPTFFVEEVRHGRQTVCADGCGEPCKSSCTLFMFSFSYTRDFRACAFLWLLLRPALSCLSGVRFWLASSIVRRRCAAWSGVSRCSAASPWDVGVASQRRHGAIFTLGSRCTSQSGEESSQDTRHAGRTPPPAIRTTPSAEAALLATQQAFGRVVVQPVRSPDVTLLGTSGGRYTRSVAASRSRRKRAGDGPQYRLL